MSITDLEVDLSQYVKDYIGGRADALADGLNALTRPNSFRAMLAEVLTNETRLREVASRSAWHPNGFAKIVLLSQPSYKLRLHVWRNAMSSPTHAGENIHNHRWDFSTVLLAGGYRHQEFRPAATGQKFLAYTYGEAGILSEDALAPMGAQTLRCVFDAHLGPGSGYTISSEVLHRVIPDLSEPAVSLVLEGPHQPASVQVFAAEDVGPADASAASRLSAEYLLRHMKAILALPTFLED